jgi:hypothetical protein
VYGAYGHNCEVAWNSEEAYLMSQGFVIAVAHVRGGGELGKLWHLDGRGFKKKNSFYDFVDVAQFLSKVCFLSSLSLHSFSRGEQLHEPISLRCCWTFCWWFSHWCKFESRRFVCWRVFLLSHSVSVGVSSSCDCESSVCGRDGFYD